jgi:hypothetical protein
LDYDQGSSKGYFFLNIAGAEQHQPVLDAIRHYNYNMKQWQFVKAIATQDAKEAYSFGRRRFNVSVPFSQDFLESPVNKM